MKSTYFARIINYASRIGIFERWSKLFERWFVCADSEKRISKQPAPTCRNGIGAVGVGTERNGVGEVGMRRLSSHGSKSVLFLFVWTFDIEGAKIFGVDASSCCLG